ncbi:MAG: glycosyltransferase family 39 protein [Acidobacteria bacterium]|nr:glycosyltransferase family 39 protein [Acidobacteriota bacterium]
MKYKNRSFNIMQTIGLRFSSPLAHVLILAAVCLPYCLRLGASSLWDASESYYAETSREMLASGNYLAPHFNFEPRAQKPPLTYWAILASYKLFGVGEFSVRFPGSAAAVMVILFSYATARFLFNSRIALMAAVITGTTARVLILARRLPIDMLLLFFLTGAFLFLARAIQTRRRAYWVFFYLFVGAGFMTKGPVALVIPAATYLIWALCNGRFSVRGVHPFLGLGILAFVILPWYVLVFHAYGWTYIETFFLKDNLGRFLSDSFGPARGPLYYFPVFAVDFFPWSFPAAAAMYFLWRHREQWRPVQSLSFGLPLLWCLFIFLFFSVSKNKQEYYIAPMYPVAAVILAAVLYKSFAGMAAAIRRKISSRHFPDAGKAPASSLNSPEGRKAPEETSPISGWKWICLILGILLFAFSILLFFILHFFMPHLPSVLHYGPSLIIAGAALFTVGCALRRKMSLCFPAIAASMWIVFTAGVVYYFPALENFRPVKSFCKQIEANAHGDFQAGYYGVTVPSMVFYLKRPIFEEYDAASMIGRFQSGNPVFCVLTARDHAFFTENFDLDLPVLDRSPRFSIKLKMVLNGGYAPGEELLLVSNRPISASAPEMAAP